MEQKPRILVVDPDGAVRQLLWQVLNEAGYETALAIDAVEALRELQRHPADVLVIDLEVEHPGGGAVECIRRARDWQPDIPIVLMSAEPESRMPRHRGVDLVLQKPFPSLATVEHRIAVALQLRVRRLAAHGTATV